MSNFLGTDYLPETPPTQDEKTLAMVTHLLTLFSFFIAPLVIYIIKKNESHFVAEHARQALNFSISYTIIIFVSILLIIVLVGILMLIVFGIMGTVWIIIAAIRASEGRLYKFPFTIEFIK